MSRRKAKTNKTHTSAPSGGYDKNFYTGAIGREELRRKIDTAVASFSFFNGNDIWSRSMQMQLLSQGRKGFYLLDYTDHRAFASEQDHETRVPAKFVDFQHWYLCDDYLASLVADVEEARVKRAPDAVVRAKIELLAEYDKYFRDDSSGSELSYDPHRECFVVIRVTAMIKAGSASSSSLSSSADGKAVPVASLDDDAPATKMRVQMAPYRLRRVVSELNGSAGTFVTWFYSTCPVCERASPKTCHDIKIRYLDDAIIDPVDKNADTQHDAKSTNDKEPPQEAKKTKGKAKNKKKATVVVDEAPAPLLDSFEADDTAQDTGPTPKPPTADSTMFTAREWAHLNDINARFSSGANRARNAAPFTSTPRASNEPPPATSALTCAGPARFPKTNCTRCDAR